MNKFLFIALLLLNQIAFAAPQCFILKDLNENKIIKEEGRCDQRISPASTFKLPLSVMGFDSGILTDLSTPEWPYHEQYAEYSFGQPCESAQIPLSWVKNSCVWYSQGITARLGKQRFQHYLQMFDYGNKDISGDPGKNNSLIRSWIASSLKISAQEQVEFISKLIKNELPASQKAHELTRAIVATEDLPNGWKIHGKTGMIWQRDKNGVPNNKRQIGWYVGWFTKNNHTLVFAYLIKDEQDQTETAGIRARDEVRQKLLELKYAIETRSKNL